MRNSGAKAVVEGVGDHGCEYMTGGIVVILGETGRNFAAGMSGGMAFVYNPALTFAERCNREMVEFDNLDEEDTAELKRLIQNHFDQTGSAVAEGILGNWNNALLHFIKVMPSDYKLVMQKQKELKRVGITNLEVAVNG